MKVWAVSLLTMELSPHSLTADTIMVGIRSLIEIPEENPTISHSVLYLQPFFIDASPKAISGRTSYYQARLAFHFLPQLIPEYCTAHGFGPPFDFRQSSPWPWQARLASGPEHIAKSALLTLAFAVPPSQKDLDKLCTQTRWLVLQKARRHPAFYAHRIAAKVRI